MVRYLYLSHTIVNAVVALASVEIFRDLKAGFCKVWICLQVRAIARLTETNIKCLLGDEFGSCESKTSKVAKMLCKTRTQPELENEQRCHLEKYSEYQYQVVLTKPAPLIGTRRNVVLTVGDLLRNTVMTIKEGQKVRAVGKLVSGLGGRRCSFMFS